MTVEQLQAGRKTLDQITELMDFKKAFNNSYTNTLRACVYSSESSIKEADKIISISNGEELHELINGYLDKKIKELRKEFEKI